MNTYVVCYKLTNNLTNKYTLGQYTTTDLFAVNWGKSAQDVKKFGADNFTKTILDIQKV